MDEQGIAQWDEVYPSKEILAGDVERKETHVIETDKQVAGFIIINENQSPEYAELEWECPGKALVVHRLTIEPSYQRKGLATYLMDFAEETAANRGYNCIRLDAFTENPAAYLLYLNRGYRKAGIVRFRKGDFYCFEKVVAPIEKGSDFV